MVRLVGGQLVLTARSEEHNEREKMNERKRNKKKTEEGREKP